MHTLVATHVKEEQTMTLLGATIQYLSLLRSEITNSISNLAVRIDSFIKDTNAKTAAEGAAASN